MHPFHWKLKDCLEELSLDIRRQLLQENQASDDQELIIRWTCPENLSKQMAGWSSEAKRVWKEILFRWGASPLPESYAANQQTGLSPARFRVGLTHLRQSGGVYQLRRAFGEPCYGVPVDVRYAGYEGSLPAPKAVMQKELGSAPAVPLWQLLLHFLLFLDREEIALTKEGQIHKRWLRKLDVELDSDFCGLEYTPWGEQEVPGVAMLRTLGEEMGWMGEKAGRLCLQPQRLHPWLYLHARDMSASLYQWCKKKLLSMHPEWEGLWWWMERYGSRRWRSLQEGVIGWCHAAGASAQIGKMREQVEKRWLRPLAALGWMELIKQGGETWWRWSFWAPFMLPETPTWEGFVQPDLEVLISPLFPLHRRWMLAQFADSMGGNPMAVYELNAASIRRGLEKGLALKDMLTVLEGIGEGPLPDNVSVMLRAWAEQAGRIRFRRMLLMELGDEVIADEIRGNPDLSPYLVEQLSSRVFAVKEEKLTDLGQVLDRLGYSPQSEPGDKDVPWWMKPPEQKLSAKGRAEDSEIRVVNALPTLEQAIPGLQQIPRMWTAQMRSYHPGTVQEMMRRAIQLELDIRMELKSNKKGCFTPKCMVQEGRDWSIEGVWEGEIPDRVGIHEIQQIQIVSFQ
jgi:hypothetical protein